MKKYIISTTFLTSNKKGYLFLDSIFALILLSFSIAQIILLQHKITLNLKDNTLKQQYSSNKNLIFSKDLIYLKEEIFSKHRYFLNTKISSVGKISFKSFEVQDIK